MGPSPDLATRRRAAAISKVAKNTVEKAASGNIIIPSSVQLDTPIPFNDSPGAWLCQDVRVESGQSETELAFGSSPSSSPRPIFDPPPNLFESSAVGKWVRLLGGTTVAQTPPIHGRGLATEKSAPIQCVEILGGNVSRTEGLILSGLEVLLIARPVGAGGGGDIYCIHSCGHGALAKFVLLDLTGHGQERDVFARAAHGLLHRFEDETRPGPLLDHLNQRYNDLALRAVYATAISAVYEPGRGEVRFANAGQPRPFLWSAGARRWGMIRPAEESDCGLPLGVKDRACYSEESVALGVGDALLLSSDGLPESRNERDEFLEPEGVLKLLAESTAATAPGSTLLGLASRFFRGVEKFRQGKESEDDLTLLWLRRIAAQTLPRDTEL